MGGIFGTISKESCVNDLYYGTDYNSHLGTRRAGMATFDKEHGFSREIHNLENNYFRSKFEDDLANFVGNQGIGVISDTDPQPIIVNSHLGRYAVVTVAKVNNLWDIAAELLQKHIHFSEMSANKINQTELVALLINMGNDFVEGINNVFRRVKGSCSMLVLTEDGIIAARDFLGRTPLTIGRKDGAYAISSETTSFPNLDYEVVRDLGPGEIVRVHADGFEMLQEAQSEEQICSFLWVYYGFPSSTYDGVNAELMRERDGELMGEQDDTEADCVCGIPDSGVGMALGYAHGHKIPYKRGVLKYTPTWPRSFTPKDQERRQLVAKMKLIPNGAILKGNRVVFCDDSIVRGTQLRDNVRTFFDNGAKEVHARISCPPLVYSCPFIGFTNSKSKLELITRRIIQEFEGDPDKKLDRYSDSSTPEYRKMVGEIARRLGLTTLKFNSIDNLVKAIGLPKCRLCTHCFDGSSHVVGQQPGEDAEK